jgi:antibiotic biosynthesis monooxygenase (ABM) superfamily enzyme
MSGSDTQAEAEFVEMLEEAELELPPSPAPRPNPSKLRFAMLLVAAVYPIITVLLYTLASLTEGWEIWHRTLVITPFMVFSIVFAVSPAINRHFGWFVAGLPRPVR